MDTDNLDSIFQKLFNIQLLYGECAIGVNNNGDVEIIDPRSDKYNTLIESGEFTKYKI